MRAARRARSPPSLLPAAPLGRARRRPAERRDRAPILPNRPLTPRLPSSPPTPQANSARCSERYGPANTPRSRCVRSLRPRATPHPYRPPHLPRTAERRRAQPFLWTTLATRSPFVPGRILTRPTPPVATPLPASQPYQLLRAVWTLVPSFAGNQQQDAHEFTRFLLERLREEFVRGAELAAASNKPARLLPRGREHGEGSNVMVDLGIPNPLRRTRSLRGGQRNGGAWTDSGANTPDAESPGAPGSARRGGASPAAIAAGLASAGLRDESRETDATMAKANGEGVGGAAASAAADGEDGGGYVVVSRWGAVRHKLGCMCRPCKSRRKTDTGEGEATPAASPAATPLAASRIKSEAAAAGAAGGSGSGSVSVAAAAAAAGGGGGDSPKPEPPRATVATGAATTTNANSPAAASPGKRSAASDADTDAAEPGSSGVDGVACALDRSGLPSDPVWRIFGGMALSRICCSTCGHASTRREPFLDISLPIPPTLPNGSPGSNAGSPLTPGSREMAEPGEGPGGCVTLQQCLAAHTRNETLAGPGRYYCERCDQVGGATKQTRLQTLPPVLCLHLKRFTWRGAGSRSKLNAHVDFPTTALNLAPYMETEDASDGSPGPTGKEAAETAAAAAAAAAEMAAAAAEMAANRGDGAYRAPRTRRNSSGAKDASAAAKAAAAELAAEQAKEAAAMAMANWIDAEEPSEGSSRPRLYDLAAAVVHHGSGAAEGHYTVYARANAAGGGGWTEFNDHKVLPATEEEVKTAGGYLFFYARRAEAPPTEGSGEV